MSLLSAFKRFTTTKPPTCSAVIAAAGSSQRCKGEDKLLYSINGKPVLVYTLEAFEKYANVHEIIIVARTQQLETIADICLQYEIGKATKIITGGETRTESVYNGINAVSGNTRYIAIHDGARPFITAKVINDTLKAAVDCNAAAPGVPVISTIKKVKKYASNNYRPTVSDTIDRNDLYEIQTPQIFRAEIIKAGLVKAIRDGVTLTDDCMAVERIGVPVCITKGDRSNLKITEYGDLLLAEALLSRDGK